MSVAFVIGGVLWVIAGFLWVARRDALAHAARFERLARKLEGGAIEEEPRANALEPGALSALEGTTRAEEPVVDPVDGARVAWVELRLEQIEAGRRTRLLERSFGAPFSVNGAQVDPRGAQIDIPFETPLRAEGKPDEVMRAILEGAEIILPDPLPRDTVYELTRRRLEVGAPVLVIGVPDPEGERETPRFAAENGPLILTREPLADVVAHEREAVTGMDRMIALTLALGLASVGVGVWLWLA